MCVYIYIYMVGGIPTPLKNMSLSVGIMTFPTEWKVIQNSVVPVTTKQKYVSKCVKNTDFGDFPIDHQNPRCAERIRILGPDIATLRTCSSSGFFNGSRTGESPCLTGKSSSYLYIYIFIYLCINYLYFLLIY